MPRPGLMPNQSYNQRMLGFSLRVDRPGGRVVRPRLRMSGTINPLLLYASMMWKRITLNMYMYIYIYHCGAPGSPHCTQGNLVQQLKCAMSIQQCHKISDELRRDGEAKSRSRCSLEKKLQYVCDNNFVYNTHFMQNLNV